MIRLAHGMITALIALVPLAGGCRRDAMDGLGADAASVTDGERMDAGADAPPMCEEPGGITELCFSWSTPDDVSGVVKAISTAKGCQLTGGTEDEHVITVGLADGKTRTLEIPRDEALPLPLSVGDAVDVTLGRAPTFQIFPWFTVKKGGQIVVHAQLDQDPRLTLPVHLERGDLVCSVSEICGETSTYRLQAGQGGTAVQIAPGGHADVGNYRVYNTGVTTNAARGPHMCPDWAGSNLSALLVRLPSR